MAKTERFRIVETDVKEVDDFEVSGEISLVEAAANRQKFLLIKSEDGEVEDIPDEAGMAAAEKALWTSAYMNDLPDSSFAYIEPGGTKDDTGKTEPRGLRHLPFKDADGAVDLPHLRNALARLPQTNLPAAAKDKARGVLEAAARNEGVGAPAQAGKEQATMDEKGMLKKVYDMLAGFFGGKGTDGVAVKTKPHVYIQASAKKEVEMVEEEIKQEDNSELKAAIGVLKAESEAKDTRIKALEESVMQAQKSARRAEVEARVEAYERDGKVIPAAKDYLIAAMLGESVTVKSEDGNAQEVTATEALDRFIATNLNVISFGEATKAAAQEDLGKFGGKTPEQFAEDVFKRTGKKPV